MFVRLAAAYLCLSSAAMAAGPRVVADVGPVHSLVSRVMQGVGTPKLLLPPGVSPHGHAMRPSEAAALEGAEVVFWVGEALSPSMEDAIATLATGADVVELLDVPGTVTRMGDEEDADEAGDHDDHDHDHHGGVDPHAWLDPDNARLWIAAIADTLARRDPDNAIIYAANAEDAQAEIAALDAAISERLAPVRGRGFVVFHDAYGYFEDHFDLPSLGAIALSDATPPSAARMAELRSRVVASGAVCAFSEPQFNAGLVTTLTEGTDLRTGILDPVGAVLEPGPALYGTLMGNLAGALAECLGD